MLQTENLDFKAPLLCGEVIWQEIEAQMKIK